MISPIAAFAGVYVAALIVTSATRLFATIQAETGHAVPVPFGSLIATLNSFGGFIIADASLPVGTLRFTLTAVPFILTALAATILFHANRTSETRRPHWDPADRLLAGACSGMVLLLTCLAVLSGEVG
ncbi:hypothetical protein [Flaviflexus huanghaiensis]|uniref:hypothetical protein n=1 Tax=Flaviflexus huanghaiensis TaxID=1111473 RepID=UPI0015FA0A7A|nr:hypothetical protein [Flaviflexus huanghaiensis]